MLRRFIGLTALLTGFAAVGCGGSSDDAAAQSPGVGGAAGTGAGGSSQGGASTGGNSGTGAGNGGGGAGGGGAGNGGGGGAPSLPTGTALAGCDGASLLTAGDDPGAHGPWPVGARTVTIDGLVTEVWYPAAIGSQEGQPRVRYDIREHLPDADAQKIPDAKNPLQDCDCYRDLPLDESHGKYPLVLFIHGTAAFRTQSLTQMTHWASRGFVVVAADHPKIQLKDALTNLFGAGMADQAGDGRKLLAAVSKASGPLAFLAGHVDASRVGVAGHSAGGGAAAALVNEDGVKVVIPMASGGTKLGKQESTVVMGAQADGIAAYSSQKNGYGSSPKRKRLVGLKNAGHLAFSDLCFIGRDQGGILQIALDSGVKVPSIVATLSKDGCQPGQLPAEDGWKIVNHVTAAALEETLHCNAGMTAKLSAVPATFADVGEYAEEL